MGKVSKKSINKDRPQPQHCFITWTDWRAFQPEQKQAEGKREDARSSSCSQIEGWHPEAFANRYRRSSYPRPLPRSTTNINLLKSQRTNSWEMDFLSSLLSTEMPPLIAEENESNEYDVSITPSSFVHELDLPDGLNDYFSSDDSPTSYASTQDDEFNHTVESPPEFNFERCLAEVEQIACESIRDLSNMFDPLEKFEGNIKTE
ncbi:hypothetical protein LTR84_008483 [Exophiala bonariae]|uniref:Uncharacterized protein n=1 Tax=Exophiala bonariae TaxID=1690606 RepID=A0AAV9MXJ4_9EURO|nr:hypothetical protein LTR84_008483 [Exophiala bonariae]